MTFWEKAREIGHCPAPCTTPGAELRDRCDEEGVSFFFKQWGGLRPKANGRLLDGRTWDELPDPRIALRVGG